MVPAVIGAFSGLCGALALVGADRIERAVLGRRPVYDPMVMALRLGLAENLDRVGRLAMAARLLYGSALGAAFGASTFWRALPRARAGIAMGACIRAFERLALPRLGATPPTRHWEWRERLLLGFHTVVFGLVNAACWRVLTGPASIAGPAPSPLFHCWPCSGPSSGSCTRMPEDSVLGVRYCPGSPCPRCNGRLSPSG